LTDTTFDLLTLGLTPGIGARTVRALRSLGAVAHVLAHPADHADLLPEVALAALGSDRIRRAAESQVERSWRQGFRIVGLDDAEYPALIQHIFDPPPVLWARGRLLADEGDRSVAIVGSRAASPQGTALARTMAADLARAGITIVSGLARGIDTAAHKGALDAGGRSVAVLGSGLDCVYPLENAALARTLAERGAVVSEFPLGIGPQPGHFPRRNRLIAGWGRGMVVVEAAQRSGALVTARVGLEEGREVMAVPGHPSHAGAAGVNALIRDGARLVCGAADVALELGFVIEAPKGRQPTADAVLEVLRRDAPASLDELAARSGQPTGELLARLAELELCAQVRRLPGALFVRT
jgi:DNA processing protein